MSPEPGSPADWMRFARSDLAIARGTTEDDALLETLCFHAQQAVEKSLKAILLSQELQFPRTHNLKILLNRLPETMVLPWNSADVAALTDYAVSARYPGDYEAITEPEYCEAIQLAEMVVKWAEDILGNPSP